MEETVLISRLREKLEEEDLVPESRQRVLIDMRGYLGWHRGTYGSDLDPDDIMISSMDLAEFRTFLLRTCQPNTVTRKLASIRKALLILAPAVLTSLRMPKVPESKKPAPSGFTKKERLSIMRAVGKLSTRDRAICMALLWTGARASSIAALKLSNVDARPRSGSVTFDVLKGGRGGRTITVPANVELREALSAWIGERPPVQHDFLFTSDRFPFDGITRWTIHDIWHRRLARELPRELAEKLKGPHQARHALARLLLDQGVPVPDVAAILGHSSVATTANIYMRPSERDLRNHLDRAVGEDGED